MRNKVIDNASESIKANKINFAAFLKQVTFDKQKVCGGMLAFERLDPLDGVDIYDQLEYEHEAIVDNSEQVAAPLCVVCKTAFPAVTLLPCRHQCVCIGCYTKWNQVDTEMLNALPVYQDYNAVNIFNRQNLTDRPNKDTVCPVCKKAVEDYIESIFS